MLVCPEIENGCAGCGSPASLVKRTAAPAPPHIGKPSLRTNRTRQCAGVFCACWLGDLAYDTPAQVGHEIRNVYQAFG